VENVKHQERKRERGKIEVKKVKINPKEDLIGLKVCVRSKNWRLAGRGV
jgi:hypothetical protein